MILKLFSNLDNPMILNWCQGTSPCSPLSAGAQGVSVPGEFWFGTVPFTSQGFFPLFLCHSTPVGCNPARIASAWCCLCLPDRINQREKHWNDFRNSPGFMELAALPNTFRQSFPFHMIQRTSWFFYYFYGNFPAFVVWNNVIFSYCCVF